MTQVRAEITANVWQVRTQVGAHVDEGDELVILESMKMEIPVTAPHSGTVTEIRVAPDDKITEGDVVVVLEP
jgi:acetyl-CoA carboxylase biotin carboxyl carrier protein